MNQALLFWIVACVFFTLLEAFTQQFVSIWLLSGSIIALIPPIILFAIAQKHLVNGMGGAVKG